LFKDVLFICHVDEDVIRTNNGRRAMITMFTLIPARRATRRPDCHRRSDEAIYVDVDRKP